MKKEWPGYGVAYCGDCLDIMPTLEKVDAIICDPPYGTTACKWDSVIPFEPMWERLNALIKDNGAIVLFGSEPFSSALRMSNIKNYKYDWIWEKQKASNFMTAKYQPLKHHEIISVFNITGYNPQKYNVIEINDIFQMNKKDLISYHKDRDFDRFGLIDKRKTFNTQLSNKDLMGSSISRTRDKKDDGTRFPKSIIKINKEARNAHPTQKPVALMQYLIKTYSNENETVLDFTAGSGTTAVACIKLGRQFKIIEKDPEYFKICCERIEPAIKEEKEKLF